MMTTQIQDNKIENRKMAMIGKERGVTVTLKLSTWKKLKIINTNRKEIDNTLSDTIEWIMKEAKLYKE